MKKRFQCSFSLHFVPRCCNWKTCFGMGIPQLCFKLEMTERNEKQMSSNINEWIFCWARMYKVCHNGPGECCSVQFDLFSDEKACPSKSNFIRNCTQLKITRTIWFWNQASDSTDHKPKFCRSYRGYSRPNNLDTLSLFQSLVALISQFAQSRHQISRHSIFFPWCVVAILRPLLPFCLIVGFWLEFPNKKVGHAGVDSCSQYSDSSCSGMNLNVFCRSYASWGDLNRDGCSGCCVKYRATPTSGPKITLRRHRAKMGRTLWARFFYKIIYFLYSRSQKNKMVEDQKIVWHGLLRVTNLVKSTCWWFSSYQKGSQVVLHFLRWKCLGFLLWLKLKKWFWDFWMEKWSWHAHKYWMLGEKNCVGPNFEIFVEKICQDGVTVIFEGLCWWRQNVWACAIWN